MITASGNVTAFLGEFPTKIAIYEMPLIKAEVSVTLLQTAYLLIAFSYVLAAVALYAGH